MNESILESVKSALGIGNMDNAYDPDVIMHINAALLSLNELGIGDQLYSITDSTQKWNEIADANIIMAVKSYVLMKVKVIFDPPTAAVLEATERQIKELEWRIIHYLEFAKEVGNE